MLRRKLGKTGIWVSVIGFGGIPIIAQPDEEAIQLVRKAWEGGINFFDTARAYQRDDLPVAASEDKIGRALKDCRQEAIICTKTQGLTAEQAERDLGESLRRLGSDYVDIWMLHAVDTRDRWERIKGPGGALEAFWRAREQGRVRHLGISGHRPDVLLDILREHEFPVVMVPVNIVDRYVFGVETTLLPYCQEQEVGVLAMKPLAGGALKDCAYLALRYCLGQAVSCAVPGMGAQEEVEENVRAGSRLQPLTPEEEEELWRKGRTLGLEFCRQCGYCLPCSVGIDIPSLFRLDGYFARYGQEEWARSQYALVSLRADACAECGDCETRCPYGLPIRQKLKQLHQRLASAP